jgi:FkbM family methyltransferase
MSLARWLPERWKERLRRRFGAITTRARLENLRQAGFAPRQIIDGGAYRGEWAALAREIFPSAELLLVEPQPALAPRLEASCRRLGRARLRSVLLGRVPGEAELLLDESNSRVLPPGAAGPARSARVPMETLARLAAEERFEACDFLKLDLQGYELEALAGAGDLFGAVEVILAEVSWIPIGGTPLAQELIAACSERGYRPYDIFGFNYRPRDRALWQADLVFVRRDSPLLASESWS